MKGVTEKIVKTNQKILTSDILQFLSVWRDRKCYSIGQADNLERLRTVKSLEQLFSSRVLSELTSAHVLATYCGVRAKLYCNKTLFIIYSIP